MVVVIYELPKHQRDQHEKSYKISHFQEIENILNLNSRTPLLYYHSINENKRGDKIIRA